MLRQDINIYLSGGESNTDPTASLGGAKSSTKIVSKEATALSTLTGVVIDVIDAAAPDGDAYFDYAQSSTQLRWHSYGNSYGDYIDIGSDGNYDLLDSAGYYVSVTVTTASLPSADTTDTTTISSVYNKLFDTVTKSDAYSGMTDYRAFYIANDVDTESDYLLQPQLVTTTTQDVKDSGTVSSGTSTTLSDNSKSWTANAYTNYFVRIIGGTGAGQVRSIVSNTTDTLTVTTAWDTQPDTTSNYQIASSVIEFGLEDIYYEESIGTGDGSTTAFSGTLTNSPVLSGQIEITDGNETFTDWDGDGTLTGSAGGTGSITYSSGAWSVTFNTAPSNGTTIKAYYTKQMQSVTNESTEPASITWTFPVDAAPLELYTTYDYLRGKGFSQAVWARRRIYKAFDSTATYGIYISGRY